MEAPIIECRCKKCGRSWFTQELISSVFCDVCLNVDPINPSHYKNSGAKCQCGKVIECIDVTRHFNFTLGNAIKYIWRSDHKQNKLEQLKKARWYIDDEIKQIEKSFEDKE